jgi:hypothetical protein
MLALFDMQMDLMPITVATWSKAWTVLACSNTGVIVSIPTWGMGICVCLFCVHVILWWVGGLRNWKSGQGPTQGCRVINNDDNDNGNNNNNNNNNNIMMMMMMVIIIIINLILRCVNWRKEGVKVLHGISPGCVLFEESLCSVIHYYISFLLQYTNSNS